jgi:hypothetical protein
MNIVTICLGCIVTAFGVGVIYKGIKGSPPSLVDVERHATPQYMDTRVVEENGGYYVEIYIDCPRWTKAGNPPALRSRESAEELRSLVDPRMIVARGRKTEALPHP